MAAPDLFDNDFEEGDLSEFTGSVTDDGTVAASTSANKNGTYGARATYDGTGGDLNIYETLAAAEDEVYVRAWFRFSSGFTLGGAYKQFRIIGLSEDATNTPLCALCLQENAGEFSWKIQLNYVTFSSIGSSYSTLDTNWKRLELYYHNNNGTGDDTARAKIYDYDGSVIWDSGDFTHSSTDHDIDTVWFGGLGHTGYPALDDYIDIDDCAADTTDWIGDVLGDGDVEQAAVGAMTLTSYNPTVGAATGLWEMGAFIYTTQGGVPVNVNPGLGMMILESFNPTVVATDAGDVDIEPNYGYMYLTSHNPIVEATGPKADRKPIWEWQSVWRKW